MVRAVERNPAGYAGLNRTAFEPATFLSLPWEPSAHRRPTLRLLLSPWQAHANRLATRKAARSGWTAESCGYGNLHPSSARVGRAAILKDPLRLLSPESRTQKAKSCLTVRGTPRRVREWQCGRTSHVVRVTGRRPRHPFWGSREEKWRLE